MPTKPSAETELRRLKRDVKIISEGRAKADALCREYRARATQAEQECAEWKARFDKLLQAIPELRNLGGDAD